MDLSFSDVFSILSLLIAISSVFLSLGLQRLEVKFKYRSEILSWYKSTLEILFHLNRSGISSEEKKVLLSKLSSNIELGRFFFPNFQSDVKGKQTQVPMAYRGVRQLVLDCLVGLFDIYSHDKEVGNKDLIVLLKKQFTSEVFVVLDPKGHQNSIKKYKISQSENIQTFESIIGKTPEEFQRSLET